MCIYVRIRISKSLSLSLSIYIYIYIGVRDLPLRDMFSVVGGRVGLECSGEILLPLSPSPVLLDNFSTKCACLFLCLENCNLGHSFVRMLFCSKTKLTGGRTPRCLVLVLITTHLANLQKITNSTILLITINLIIILIIIHLTIRQIGTHGPSG